jgi:hypothetical protein
MREPVLGIADWELPFGPPLQAVELSGSHGADQTLVYPRGAQQLLDRLAPHLAGVTDVLRPLLAAQGLSLTEARLDDVLARAELAGAVVEAAAAVVARGEGLAPVGAQALTDRASRDQLSGSGEAEQPWQEAHPPGWAETGLPGAPRPGPSPMGWTLPRASSPRHLAYDAQGEPCYPDTPAFEAFWPKCPVPETDAAFSDVPCTDDARFVRAEQRLQTLRHFERLPSSFRGFDYRLELKRSVSLPVEALYRCGERPSSPHALASWIGPPGPGVIRLYERFLDLELEWDLLSELTGAVDFRAAVLLHEHVHRIEDPQQGTVDAPAERSYQPVGSAGQDDCLWSGTEYDAAYLQTLYLGGSEAVARMVGDIYGRAQCGLLGPAAQLLAAAGDLIEALALGWTASLEVIVTLTARLAQRPNEAMALLSSLLPDNVAAILLLGLPL